MAVALTIRHSHHAGGILLTHCLKHPSRTYIPVASAVLQQHHWSETNKQRTCLGYGYHVQNRRFSRQTFAYYLSSDFPPIGAAQLLFETVHSIPGLPWWSAILVTTWGLRAVITVPLAVYTAHMSARLEQLRPEIDQTLKQLKAEVMTAKEQKGWTEQEAFRQFKINMRRLIKEFYIRENCHPAKTTILVWVQIPMWISLSLALRNISGALPLKGIENVVSAPDLSNEGFLWVPNLLLADTTFIIPVAVGLLNLIIIEMHALRPGTPSRFQRGLTWTFRGLSVIMIPIAATVPSCMAFYWACSSSFGLVQNIVLRLPSFRRACGIPCLRGESATPFKDLARVAREKYSWKKKTETS